MFISGLESFQDHLTWYYVVAVVISILAVFIAFLFNNRRDSDLSCDQKENKQTKSCHGETTYEDVKEEEDESDQNDESEEALQDAVKRNIKQSPALMAEMVIKANMTEEQRSLEQEVRQKQLAEIFKLMQQETDKFGDISLLELEEQMKLYQ